MNIFQIVLWAYPGMSKFSQSTFRSRFLSHDTSRVNVQIGTSENVDNRLDQGRQMQTTSFGIRSFGQQSRNVTTHSSMLQEGSLRLNQDHNQKNNTSIISRSFCPAATGLQMENVVSYNDNMLDEGIFQRPTMLSLIRGRNSTISSRLFHDQNAQQQFREFNSRNMSHISHRSVDILSESRLALNMRRNWMDNQSHSGSVNLVSLKAQVRKLLDNFHYSILSMCPPTTAECVSLELEKLKQCLDNLSEVSFAPLVKQRNVPSVINQSKKYTCPPIYESTVENNDAVNLRSGKEIVKSFISPGVYNRSKILSSKRERKKDSEMNSSMRESIDEEESSIVCKEPKPLPKERNSSTGVRIKVVNKVKSQSKSANRSINLKQWYPVADGSDLLFCGIDAKGATVKTDPVKKRLTNRKVELVSGTNCNLTGSPSTVVSVLPMNVAKLLKNGLTDRWRVLQRELLNCQVAEEGRQTRVSKSPRKRNSPPNKKPAVIAQASKGSKVVSKGSIDCDDSQGTLTRSGRCVKPPAMFWMSNSSSSNKTASASETSKIVKSLMRKGTNKRERIEGSSKKAVNKSPGKGSPKKPSPEKEENSKKGRKKPQKEESPKRGRRKGSKEEVVKVESSTRGGNRRHNVSRSPSKRKREDTTDADHVQKKKSKIDSKTEEESLPEPVTTSVERVEPASRSRARRGRKPLTKKNEVAKKKQTEEYSKTKETSSLSEFEGNFEFKLDDIEIPEIANVSGNPLLSRSQLRLVNMETPPLKYFNSNLQLIRSSTTTPVASPNWCISQRTESEGKQFQRRREEAFKKRVKTIVEKKTMTLEKTRNVKNRDVEIMMEWVAEKTVRSPQSNSKVVQFVIPSRKRMEAEEDDDEEENFEFS